MPSFEPSKIISGRDCPRSYAHLRAWFDEDWKCGDYLDWLRWPDGFVCPHCTSRSGWRPADNRWKCGGCDHNGLRDLRHDLRQDAHAADGVVRDRVADGR